MSPRVVIKDVSVRPLGNDGVFSLSVVIENEGYLSTYITQRALDAQVERVDRDVEDQRDEKAGTRGDCQGRRVRLEVADAVHRV